MGWELSDDETLELPSTAPSTTADDIGRILKAKAYFARLRKEQQKNPDVTKPSKSAFQFQNRKIREQAEKDSEDNIARIRKERRDQYASGTSSRPSENPPMTSEAKATPPVVKELSSAVKSISKPSVALSSGASPSRSRQNASETAFQKAEREADEMRRVQKERYKRFQQDPDARNSEAYKRPASVANGAKVTDDFSWWNPLTWGSGWGGGDDGSSGSGGGPRPNGGGERRSGPRIKTVADLPKPPSGGG